MRSIRHAAALLATTLAAPALAVDVTTCGQRIPAGSVAVLQADLDCTGFFGVILEGTSTLQLNGHTLSGVNAGSVYCQKGKCVIQGPGEIRDSGLLFEQKSKGVVSGVDFVEANIRGHTRTKVQLENVSLLRGRVQVSSLRGSGVVVQDSDPAQPTFPTIYGDSVTLEDSTITGGAGRAIYGAAIKLANVTIAGAGGVGVDAQRSVRALDSTITGNDTAGTGIDIRSVKRPRVIRTTCGRSADENGAPWGVCAND